MKKQILTLMFALFFMGSVHAQDSQAPAVKDVEKLHIFSSGQPAKADHVNENFKHLNQKIEAGPIIGEWSPSVWGDTFEVNTHVPVIFDMEHFNTRPDYFEQNAEKNGIIVKKAGYYRMDVRGLSYNKSGRGNYFILMRENKPLHYSHDFNINHQGSSWRRHNFSIVRYLNENEKVWVKVYCRDTTDKYCYHHGNYTSQDYEGLRYTALTIQKL